MCGVNCVPYHIVHSHNVRTKEQLGLYRPRCAVRLSVTFRYRDYIRWNTSKIIISRMISLRLMLGLTPTGPAVFHLVVFFSYFSYTGPVCVKRYDTMMKI